ncbi:MAG: ferritin-like domain-containing protein [Myxococcota bacterium]
MISVSSVEFLSSEGPLDHAARASDTVAARWVHALTPADRHDLIRGFYMAETLAGMAIEQARTQLPAQYQAGLETQAADEARHIEVFTRWLGAPPALPTPKMRQRQHIQWLMVLLVNELTGFCQFHLLARLLEEPAAIQAVQEIAADERTHIKRLLDWLEPLWNTRSAQPVGEFVDRFRRDLPGRMCQFFPRAALQPLREELVNVIDALLQPFSAHDLRA